MEENFFSCNTGDIQKNVLVSDDSDILNMKNGNGPSGEDSMASYRVDGNKS